MSILTSTVPGRCSSKETNTSVGIAVCARAVDTTSATQSDNKIRRIVNEFQIRSPYDGHGLSGLQQNEPRWVARIRDDQAPGEWAAGDHRENHLQPIHLAPGRPVSGQPIGARFAADRKDHARHMVSGFETR